MAFDPSAICCFKASILRCTLLLFCGVTSCILLNFGKLGFRQNQFSWLPCLNWGVTTISRLIRHRLTLFARRLISVALNPRRNNICFLLDFLDIRLNRFQSILLELSWWSVFWFLPSSPLILRQFLVSTLPSWAERSSCLPTLALYYL